MRRVIASEFVSLDGVMEDPSWTFRFVGEDWEAFKFDELSAADALLLGRVTFEGFAAAWPGMAEQTGEYGAWMNGYPKHVVSTTLEEPLEWNATLIEGDVAEGVAALKEQPGKDILVFGSADLVGTLMQHDLIDEYRIMVFPVVVGSGKRLFGDGTEKILELVETKTFGSGVVVLTYRPAGRRVRCRSRLRACAMAATVAGLTCGAVVDWGERGESSIGCLRPNIRPMYEGSSAMTTYNYTDDRNPANRRPEKI